MEEYEKKIEEATSFIRPVISDTVQNGIILGSGLGGIADEVKREKTLPYSSIPGFPKSTISGHKGEVIYGELAGKKIIVFNGRYHYYQGYSLSAVTLPIRVAKRLGVRNMIVTNSSGGINRSFKPGDIMLIKDHINLMGNNPLIGIDAADLGNPFIDMSDPYDRDLRAKIKKIASRSTAIGKLREGIYIAISGPSYETASEISFFRTVGADAVGMSTVPEVIVCAHEGIRVIGISAVANMATDLRKEKLTHKEILRNTAKVSERMTRLIKEILKNVL